MHVISLMRRPAAGRVRRSRWVPLNCDLRAYECQRTDRQMGEARRLVLMLAAADAAGPPLYSAVYVAYDDNSRLGGGGSRCCLPEGLRGLPPKLIFRAAVSACPRLAVWLAGLLNSGFRPPPAPPFALVLYRPGLLL